MKDSSNQTQESWYICWSCQTNLGFRETSNPPPVCDSCEAPGVAFAIPPDPHSLRVNEIKRDRATVSASLLKNLDYGV